MVFLPFSYVGSACSWFLIQDLFPAFGFTVHGANGIPEDFCTVELRSACFCFNEEPTFHPPPELVSRPVPFDILTLPPTGTPSVLIRFDISVFSVLFEKPPL